ncbi:MAG: GTP 3',8-cyclase MoaA, partial [Oscillospiraceae bacterium]|nr:GTP 3',8-cyclase MoaA [Oscillospiraceae bacterium]
ECSRVRITADGKLKPCLHSAAELSLRGLSGDELEAAIRRGILMKPERHHMDETGETEAQRGMFAIGG